MLRTPRPQVLRRHIHDGDLRGCATDFIWRTFEWPALLAGETPATIGPDSLDLLLLRQDLLERNWNLSIPSFLMRNSRVEWGKPSRLAAPRGPETRPWAARNAASMASRSRAWSCPLSS